MPIPNHAGADAAPDRDAVELEDILGEGDAQLVIEALYRLREDKVDALQNVRAEGLRPGGRAFEPRDFGIPQIDRLLARLGAEPVDESLSAAER